MKEKYIILLTIVGFIFSSCIPDRSAFTGEDINVDYESIKPLESYIVHVPDGKIAYVILGNNDTIASTSMDGSKIYLPKNQYISSRAIPENLIINYEVYKGEPYYSTSTIYCVAFEDSKYGDYDFNDVILHLRVQNNNGSYKFFCQPIAMGASKILKFGLNLSCFKDGQLLSNDFTFSNDLRLDVKFFGSKDQERSFVNTSANHNDYYRFPYQNISPCDGQRVTTWLTNNNLDSTRDNISFIWWIQDDSGQKYYSVPTIKDEHNPIDYTDGRGFPYGLVISEVHDRNIFFTEAGLSCGLDWFNYPLEGVSIQLVYPGFNGWLNGTDVINWNQPKEGLYVDAIGETRKGERPTNPYSLFVFDDLSVKEPIIKYTGYLYR